MKLLRATAVLSLSMLLFACGGEESMQAGSGTTSTTSSVVTEAGEADATAPDSSTIGPELEPLAAKAEQAGYKVEALKPGDLQVYAGGLGANGSVSALAGMTVLGRGLEGESSGSGGATVYALQSEEDVGRVMKALKGIASESVGLNVYFVGQSPPSHGLEKLIDTIE